jgi:hypothetical protein
MGNGRIPVQSLMGSIREVVLVFLDEFLQQSFQMLLVQHDYMVQQLLPQRPSKSFNKWILPGASVRRADFLDTAAFQERLHSQPIDAVIIPEQVLRLFPKRHGLYASD